MKRIIVTTILLSAAVFAQSRRNEQDKEDFLEMKQILRVATADLEGKRHRVVFAAEDNQAEPGLRHWMVTAQTYPADYAVIDYRYFDVLFNGPPCPQGKAGDFCRIRDISGEVLFQGRFDTTDNRGHVRRFVGNTMSTASRMSAFLSQLRTHREWTQADLAVALASAGAKFGPDKEKEFRATLPAALPALEKAFGPLRVHKVLFPKPIFGTTQSGETTLTGFQAYWEVIVIPLRAPKDRIAMNFDPFEGQLQLLVVTGLFKTWDSKAKKYKLEYIDPDDK